MSIVVSLSGNGFSVEGTSALAADTEIAPERPVLSVVPTAAVDESPEPTADIAAIREESESEHIQRWTAQDYLKCFDDPCDDNGAAAKLADSGVAPLVVAARGYGRLGDADEYRDEVAVGTWDLPKPTTATGRGLAALAVHGVLVMPWFTPADLSRCELLDQALVATSLQVRPTKPRPDQKGKPRKYEFIAGSKTPIGVHPAYPMEWVEKAPVVLFAEGMLKGDSALTAYLIHHGATRDDLAWDGGDDYDAREALLELIEDIAPEDRVVIMTLAGVGNWHNNAEWNAIDLRGREAWIGVDGDVKSNENVWKQTDSLYRFAKGKKKAKRVELLAPTVECDDKVGIDDYLAKHDGTWASLSAMKSSKLPPKPVSEADIAKGIMELSAALTRESQGGSIFGEVPDTTKCRETARLKFTRMAMAERLHAHYGEVIAWRPSRGWMYFDGTVWKDGELEVHKMYRTVARSIRDHEAKFAEEMNEEVQRLQARIDKLGDGATSDEVVSLKKAKQAARQLHENFADRAEDINGYPDGTLKDLRGFVLVEEDQWDSHPFRWNFKNGTINIKDRDESGRPLLLPHNPAHRITMVTEVDYDPDAWSEDLDSIREHIEMSGEGTWTALTRYLGYACTGAMEAKTYLNIWSENADAAKSTLLDAVKKAMGGKGETSYVASLMPSEIGAAKSESGKAQPALDALRGKRLIIVSEAQHVHIGSDLMKSWTGGDTMNTRTLNSKGSEWDPAGKFVLVGQGPTPFSIGDQAMVSRFFGIALKSLPPEKVDTNLRVRLAREDGLKAVLAMLVQAACDWYDDYKNNGMSARQALAIPAHAETQKAEAIASINPLTDWIDAYLEVKPEDEFPADLGHRGRATTAHLCDLYNAWARRVGLPVQTPRKFGPLLESSGFGKVDTEFIWDPDSRGKKVKVKGQIRTGCRVRSRSDWERLIGCY